MDFRDRNLTEAQIEKLHEFIIKRKLYYQPYLFTDSLEVGEGLCFRHGEHAGGEVYWENSDPRARRLETDKAKFRSCNAELRRIYEHWLDHMTSVLGGDLTDVSAAEIGSSSGYFLFGLALRGARSCTGYDFLNMGEVYAWFNEVLGTNVQYRVGEWDGLHHSLRHTDVPESDLMISAAVLCHVPDPVYHLAYLCDHARRAVFVWTPVNKDSGYSLTYGKPAKYPDSLSWPLSFDSEVRFSDSLLKLSLEKAGFEDIREIPEPPHMSDGWKHWYRHQKGYLAYRTSNVKTALGGGKNLHRLQKDVIVSTV